MKRTKICFVAAYGYSLFNPDTHILFGGAELQLYQYAKRLSKDPRFEISFLVGDVGQKKQEVYDGITVFKSFKIGVGKKLKRIWIPFQFLFSLWKINADVYIQRAAGFETGLIALFCKTFKRKFIFMSASSIDFNGGFKKIDFWANIFFEYGLKRAHVVLTQGKEQRKSLKERYFLNSFILKNSFEIGSPPSLDQKKSFLWVGSSQPLKQPSLFLQMAQKMPQESFVMIMPKHNPSLWDTIKNEASSIRNLTFIEKVPFQEINHYFAKAKFLINTSKYEGFPNTFIQAAISCTPILSLIVNPDEFLNNNHCGFSCHEDINFMIEKASELSKDNLLWGKMCENAFIYAKLNHDININVQKLIPFILN